MLPAVKNGLTVVPMRHSLHPVVSKRTLGLLRLSLASKLIAIESLGRPSLTYLFCAYKLNAESKNSESKNIRTGNSLCNEVMEKSYHFHATISLMEP